MTRSVDRVADRMVQDAHSSALCTGRRQDPEASGCG
jgi:hypothetical protein